MVGGVITIIGLSYFMISGLLGLLISVASAKAHQRDEAAAEQRFEELSRKWMIANRRIPNINRS